MKPLVVALLQMNPQGADQDSNLEKGDRYCRLAHEMGAEIALFPEMWNIGYSFFDTERAVTRKAWLGRAIGPQSPFLRHFAGLAKELDMAIAITYLERTEGAPRNTVTVMDRHGNPALTYSKVHTCTFDVEAALAPGSGFRVCTLDTRVGDVVVGAMICYDREFPESARLLMLEGAEIILTPNACELEKNRLGQFRARAFENMVGVAMANYAAPKANGHSVAYDGMAFHRDGRSREPCLVKAGEQEGVFLARFDIAALRAYGEREVWGRRFRRPECYWSLAQPDAA